MIFHDGVYQYLQCKTFINFQFILLELCTLAMKLRILQQK